MEKNIKSFFAHCKKTEPASEDSINQFENIEEKKLPKTYKSILEFSNGLEGWIGDKKAYLCFYGIEDISEINKAYRSSEFIPGMLIIGSDGGGELIALDLRENSPTYGGFWRVPSIPMDIKSANYLGRTITDFVKNYINVNKLPKVKQL